LRLWRFHRAVEAHLRAVLPVWSALVHLLAGSATSVRLRRDDGHSSDPSAHFRSLPASPGERRALMWPTFLTLRDMRSVTNSLVVRLSLAGRVEGALDSSE